MHLAQPRPPITPAAFGVASATAAVCVLAVAVGEVAPFALAAAAAFVLAAASVDLASGRIPDRLVIAALASLAVVPLAAGDLDLVAAMTFGAALLAGPLLVVHVVSPDAMGFGDVKFAVPLGALVGLVDPRLALLALFVASSAAGATGLVRRRPTVVFGPALALGAAVAAAADSIGSAVPWR